MTRWWRSHATLRVLGLLLLGQLVSLSLALASLSSSLISQQFGIVIVWLFLFSFFFVFLICIMFLKLWVLDMLFVSHYLWLNNEYVYIGVYAPLTQSLFLYASLALVYGSILLYRHHKPLVGIHIYRSIFADSINQ